MKRIFMLLLAGAALLPVSAQAARLLSENDAEVLAANLMQGCMEETLMEFLWPNKSQRAAFCSCAATIQSRSITIADFYYLKSVNGEVPEEIRNRVMKPANAYCSAKHPPDQNATRMFK